MPKFSIVVPTRNRANTLLYTLKTCLNQQDFDDYEVIVSDNFSDDDIADVVEALGSDKVRYFKTDAPLAMTDHWNFAIDKAKGEYIMFLGSDDGIHSYGLYALNQIVSLTGEKVVQWNANHYTWPCVRSTNSNVFCIHDFNNKPQFININAKSLVKDVVGYKQPVNRLPMIYYRSIIHRSLTDELKSITSAVFDSTNPDYYSSFAILSLIQSFIDISLPIAASGISGNSNGGSHNSNVKTSTINEFLLLNNQSGKISRSNFFDGGILSLVDYIIANDFIAAKRNLNAYDDIEIDYTLHIKAVINERYGFYMFKGDEGKASFQEELKLIEKIIRDDNVLSSCFDGSGLDIQNYTFLPPEYDAAPHINNDLLRIDLTSMEIDNIYDAINFAEKLLYPRKRIDFYLKRFKESWESLGRVNQFYEKLRSFDKVGLYAVGRHSDRLIEGYRSYCGDTKRFFMFDSNELKWGQEHLGIKVLPPHSIPEQNLDALVISSFRFQNEIFESVKQYSNDLKIIKLYGKDGEDLPPNYFV